MGDEDDIFFSAFPDMTKLWYNAAYGKAYSADYFTEGGEKPWVRPEYNRTRIIMPGTPAWHHVDEIATFVGLDMLGSITITDKEFDEISAEQWEELEELANAIPNLEVDEVVEGKLLHVYTRIPCITSLERI